MRWTRGILTTVLAGAIAMQSANAQSLPTAPGEAAFGAISEVVRLLKADSSTDWSKVDIEALRQHPIDMDDVVMRAVVVRRDIPGGAEFRVTGAGRVAGAIKRMTLDHFAMLDGGTEYHASATALSNGALVTVTARNASDTRMVDRIRGLGFAGLLADGDHHAMHHMMLARGSAVMR